MARKARRGRPPMPEGVAKGTMFCIRLAPWEHAAIKAASAHAGTTTSAWVRVTLIAAAQKENG